MLDLYFNTNLDLKHTTAVTKYYFVRGRGKQNTILPQIIVIFVIKAADLTVNIIRPDIILNNTTQKKKLKYAPILTSYSRNFWNHGILGTLNLFWGISIKFCTYDGTLYVDFL